MKLGRGALPAHRTLAAVTRTVTAVVTSGAECVGVVGPFDVDVAWWSEVEPVVSHLRPILGVPVVVLRLLHVDGTGARDGHVTYHVEATGTTATLPPSAVDLDSASALRATWARLDGLNELLTWAGDTLASLGRPVTGPVEQRKTWNLAGLFRLPTAMGPVWLKALPPFAADEARAMAAFAGIDPTLVPDVIAAEPDRLLLEHLPGEDCWDADPSVIADGVRRFVAAQNELTEPVPWLRDRRTPTLVAQIEALLDRDLELTSAELAATRRLLPRFAELDDCGLPDTIVHGDLHSGNMRADGGPPAVLDFADAYFGNPVLDGLRMVDFLRQEKKAGATVAWVDAWLAVRPDSDPARALVVAEPLAQLAYAVRYQEFLDGIEESEQIYHLGDPAACVLAAIGAGPTGR